MSDEGFPSRRSVTLASGHRLSVAIRAGDGSALVLLHGLTDCADSFARLVPYLPGNHLIIPDLRGHGASFRHRDLSYGAFVDDMSQLLDALDIHRATVIGHSMGALIALGLAARRRDIIDRLVLLAGALRPEGPALQNLRKEIGALVEPLSPSDPFFDRWYHCESPVPKGFLSRLAASAAAMDRKDWLTMVDMLRTTDHSALAQSLDLPALALTGDADPIFPPERLALLTATMPDCRPVVLEGCGHNPHWEMPQTVAGHLLAFCA